MNSSGYEIQYDLKSFSKNLLEIDQQNHSFSDVESVERKVLHLCLLQIAQDTSLIKETVTAQSKLIPISQGSIHEKMNIFSQDTSIITTSEAKTLSTIEPKLNNILKEFQVTKNEIDSSVLKLNELQSSQSTKMLDEKIEKIPDKLSEVLRLLNGINSTLVNYLPTDLCDFRPSVIEKAIADIRNQVSDISTTLNNKINENEGLIIDAKNHINFPDIQKTLSDVLICQEESSQRNLASASVLDSIQHTLTQILEFTREESQKTLWRSGSQILSPATSVTDITGLEEIKQLIVTFMKPEKLESKFDNEASEIEFQKSQKRLSELQNQIVHFEEQKDTILEEISTLREQRTFLIEEKEKMDLEFKSPQKLDIQELYFLRNEAVKLDEHLSKQIASLFDSI
ncbi:hypothetical protein HK096_000718 [Nowakowskiella sp. JEL0078]|nr:hypothetical protein HK096_000718 [Nowakowskiella sp. JEL0078]